jgi:hypothetical protein
MVRLLKVAGQTFYSRIAVILLRIAGKTSEESRSCCFFNDQIWLLIEQQVRLI